MMTELSKEEIKTKKFYKILPENLICKEYQYKEGLNIDTNKFDNFECQNGLHFSDATYIMYFCDYGTKIAEVEVPEDEVVLYENTNIITKYKSHSIILKNVRDLWDLNTIKDLKREGVNINISDDYILRIATQDNQLDIVKYLVDHGADIHADNDAALNIAAENGYLEIVKYLVDHGADIHADNDAALKIARYNHHLDVVEYLMRRV